MATKKFAPKKKAAKKSAKKKPHSVGGPFLGCAVFCESILEDKGGVLSVMRMIDTVKLFLGPEVPAGAPNKEHPVPVIQPFLMHFTTGDAPIKHLLKLAIESPDGTRKELPPREIALNKEKHGGGNIKAQIPVSMTEQGVYWVDVFLDDKLMTRVPLNITCVRLDSLPIELQ